MIFGFYFVLFVLLSGGLLYYVAAYRGQRAELKDLYVQLRELRTLDAALQMRPGDEALMKFAGGYADACERYEKAHPGTAPITFTAVKHPLQDALLGLFTYYRELAARTAARHG